MGVVFKARDPFIDRTVALKTLTTGFSEDPHHLKRFYSEARSAGNLRHPNIVTIFELGHEGDTPFIAMQFLSGESLDKIIDRMPNLPLSQKLGFIVYVCRALDPAKCAIREGNVSRNGLGIASINAGFGRVVLVTLFPACREKNCPAFAAPGWCTLPSPPTSPTVAEPDSTKISDPSPNA
jgi:serine/threonine protein kinase